MKNLLVIDDSEINLYLVEAIFSDDPDINVVLIWDSRKALEKIKQIQPEMILLDLMMPHIDGYQILYQMKTDPDLSDIPVVILSARHDDESVKKAMEYGAADYIKKPINSFKLKYIIHNLMKTYSKKPSLK